MKIPADGKEEALLSEGFFFAVFEKAPLRCAPRLPAFGRQSGDRFTESVFPRIYAAGKTIELFCCLRAANSSGGLWGQAALRLFADVGQDAAVHIQDVAIDKIGGVGGQKDGGAH